MDRYVMRHPETGGVAIMPASSVDHHRDLGWVRVSEAIDGDDAHRVILRDYAEAPDLDAPTPDVPADEPEQEQPDQQADPAESEE